MMDKSTSRLRPESRTAWLYESLAACTIGALWVLFSGAASPAAAQSLQFRHVATLRGGETLTVPDPPLPGVLVPTRGGGWLYSGFMEQWTWGEFDARGNLVNAPGRRWSAGGPGEFREIVGTFPLSGDTLLVIEAFAATRVLRDGSYLDRIALPFAPGRHYTVHRNRIWLAGRGPGGTGVSLFAYPVLSPEPVRVSVPSSNAGSSSGQPLSWNGNLWVWLYPRGPLVRVDPATGASVETWQPPLDRRRSGWRAFATGGPDGTIIFRVDPASRWVVFDSGRSIIASEPVPQDMLATYLVDSRYAMTFSLASFPVPYPNGVRVYEYYIRRGP